MNYIEQQLHDLRSEFAKRRRRQLLALIPVAAVVAVFFTANEKTGTSPLGPIAVVMPLALAVLVGVVIFSFANWRCPACKKYLGRSLNPRFCSDCGVELR